MDNDDHALDEFSDEEVKNILRDALKVKITERRERPKKNRLN